jgi:hypothetical protein
LGEQDYLVFGGTMRVLVTIILPFIQCCVHHTQSIPSFWWSQISSVFFLVHVSDVVTFMTQSSCRTWYWNCSTLYCKLGNMFMIPNNNENGAVGVSSINSEKIIFPCILYPLTLSARYLSFAYPTSTLPLKHRPCFSSLGLSDSRVSHGQACTGRCLISKNTSQVSLCSLRVGIEPESLL